MYELPMRPATGPPLYVLTAEVRRTLAMPPVLWIIIIGCWYRRSRSSSPIPESSSYIDWCRYALSSVIIVRGYS